MQNPLTAIHLSKSHETNGLRFLRFSALKGKPKNGAVGVFTAPQPKVPNQGCKK